MSEISHTPNSNKRARTRSPSPAIEALPPTPEGATRDSDDLDDFIEKATPKSKAAFIRPSDEEIMKHERALKKEFEAAPAVSEFKPFDDLQQDYKNGHEIVKAKLDVCIFSRRAN